MLTGLVYAAVVVLWAVVLVPQWLRRHERNSEHRTALTFHRAMRTLERRSTLRGASRAPHDHDVVVSGARSKVHDRVSINLDGESPIDQHLDHGIDPFVGGAEEAQLRDTRRNRSQMRARAAAARRRRQVQQVLVGLSVISVLLFFIGAIPLMMGLLAPVGLGAFLYAVRKQQATVELVEARRKRSASARDEASESTAAARVRGAAREVKRGKRSDRRTSARRHVERVGSGGSRGSYAEAGTDDARMLSDDEVVDRRSSVAADGEWEPVEAPLPGYVNGSRATRTPRNLDSAANGDWTSERMLEQLEALRSPGADAEHELGLDDFVKVPGAIADHGSYEHRRAVND